MIEVGTTGMFFERVGDSLNIYFLGAFNSCFDDKSKFKNNPITGYPYIEILDIHPICSLAQIWDIITQEVPVASPSTFVSHHLSLITECIRFFFPDLPLDYEGNEDEEWGGKRIFCKAAAPFDLNEFKNATQHHLNLDMDKDWMILDEFDILHITKVSNIHLNCRIKQITSPKKSIKSQSFYQECVIYDDDTNKTIPAKIIGDAVSYDNYKNGMRIELLGEYDISYTRELVIYQIRIIDDDYEIPIESRNQKTPGYDKWHDAVINRDKVCQCCGLDKHPQAHHIYGYAEHPELAIDVNNGIVLCKFCHDKYHSIYGLKNINPHDLIDFIKKYGVH